LFSTFKREDVEMCALEQRPWKRKVRDRKKGERGGRHHGTLSRPKGAGGAKFRGGLFLRLTERKSRQKKERGLSWGRSPKGLGGRGTLLESTHLPKGKRGGGLRIGGGGGGKGSENTGRGGSQKLGDVRGRVLSKVLYFRKRGKIVLKAAVDGRRKAKGVTTSARSEGTT